MSTQITQNSSSNKEVTCPDCEKTFNRPGDLRRHRNTQHPDGPVVKHQCPFAGCQYKAAQKSNLRIHFNARHSTVRGNLCPTCSKAFADPATLISHRKTLHAYQPHHTPQYYARRALKKAEKGRGNVAFSNTRDHKAASVFPSQSASSSMDNSNSANATYHNKFWNLHVDAPRSNASESELNVSQDVQISVPVSMEPSFDTPTTLRSHSDLYLPIVGQQPSTAQKCDIAFLLNPQLDTTVQPQSQTLAPSWTAYDQIPGVASDSRPFPFAATVPASGGQSTYPGMDFQSRPASSFPNVPSIMPHSFNFQSISTASSSRISGNRFVFPNRMVTPPPRQQVPALSWTPSLSPADSTPLSQTEFFTGEAKRGFGTWPNFAQEL